MKFVRSAVLFAILGIGLIAFSALLAQPLVESRQFRFPESLFQHYLARKQGYETGIEGNTSKTLEPTRLVGVLGVEIESTSADIRIELQDDETKGATAELHTPGGTNGDPIQLLVDGEKLLVRVDEATQETRRSGLQMSFGDSKNATLTVRLPPALESLRIRTKSGDVVIVGPATATVSMEMESESGDLFIGDNDESFPRPRRVRMTTVSGHLRAKELSLVDFKSVSGDLVLSECPEAHAIQCASVSGNCSVFFNGPVSSKLHFVTTSGDLFLSLDDSSDQTPRPLKHPKNTALTIGTGKGQISATTVSGDLRIGQTLTPADAI